MASKAVAMHIKHNVWITTIVVIFFYTFEFDEKTIKIFTIFTWYASYYFKKKKKWKAAALRDIVSHTVLNKNMDDDII